MTNGHGHAPAETSGVEAAVFRLFERAASLGHSGAFHVF